MSVWPRTWKRVPPRAGRLRLAPGDGLRVRARDQSRVLRHPHPSINLVSPNPNASSGCARNFDPLRPEARRTAGRPADADDHGLSSSGRRRDHRRVLAEIRRSCGPAQYQQQRAGHTRPNRTTAASLACPRAPGSVHKSRHTQRNGQRELCSAPKASWPAGDDPAPISRFRRRGLLNRRPLFYGATLTPRVSILRHWNTITE